MRMLAAFLCFLVIISFFVFVWFSHTNVLKGDPAVEGWCGVALFLIACYGRVALEKIHECERNRLLTILLFMTAVLAVFHAIAFFTLFAAGMIGPRLAGMAQVDKNLVIASLFAFYALMAVLGIKDIFFLSRSK